jgi:hypothetical protein
VATCHLQRMRRFHQEVRQFPNWNENPPGKKPQRNLQGLPREGEGGQNGKSKFLLEVIW